LMGRERVEPEAVEEVAQTTPKSESLLLEPEVSTPPVVAPAVVPPRAVSVPTALPVEDVSDDEAELVDIFLEEAREVVQNGLIAARALAEDPSNLAEQTTLRRAFHTLKGSSRMVGLNDFGEAAWSFEQLFNNWLAEQRPASDDLITAASAAMHAFGRWVKDIAGETGAEWSAQDFRKSSDALRLDGMWIPLHTPGAPESQLTGEPEVVVAPGVHAVESTDIAFAQKVDSQADLELPVRVDFAATQLAAGLTPAPEEVRPDFAATQTFDFEATQAFEHESARASADAFHGATEVTEIDFGDFDFGDRPTAGKPEPEIAPPLVDAVMPEVSAPPEVATPGVLVDQSTEAETQPEPELEATVEEALSFEAEPAAQEAPVEEEGAKTPEMASVADEVDEQVKVIGHLRLSIPLYNVYLNEADEWSRRLQVELSEWAMELQRPLPDSLVTLAHSLLGSSATVGFVALSDMARSLEQALQHVQLHRQGTPAQAEVFSNAAEDIRRLLHQFAAGFLKESDATVLAALQAIIDTQFPAPTMDSIIDALDDELVESDDLEPEVLETPVEVAAAAPVELPAPAALTVVAAPLNIAQAQDDEIDAVDHLDDDLFPIFEEEAIELMPQLGSALRQWVALPDNLKARNEVLRVLHTLKGSARLAGAMRLGEMSHRMESSIEQIGTDHLQSVQLEPLLTRFDALQATFQGLSETPVEEEQSVEVPSASATPAPVGVPVRVLPRSLVVAPVLRQSANQSVRVRSQLLDRLVNQAGEVMISRARMEARLTQLRSSLGDLSGNLERLRSQLRDVELQSESQMQSRLAQTKDSAQAFDPLEFDRFTRVQELTRMMAESVHDVATVQRNLQ